MQARVWMGAGVLALIALAGPALAASAASPEVTRIAAAWRFDPFAIVVALALVVAYLRGLVWVYGRSAPYADWRPVAFLCGVGVMVLAMISPLAMLAEHMYWIEHVQVMLLRIVGPLVIFLAEPQRLIHVGVPKRLRRGVIAPLLRDPRLARVEAWARRPVLLTPVFVLVFYLWQTPLLQDAVIRHGVVRYAMLLSVTGLGLLFFSVIFDRRDAPEGPRHGVRVLMLIVTAFSSVLMGVAFTLKPKVMFAPLGMDIRMFGMTALDDEAAGGFLNWALVSMILLVCILFVFSYWNRAEERYWAEAQRRDGSNSRALMVPETAEELWLMVGPRNKRLGWGLAIIPVVMMSLAIATVVAVRYLPWNCLLYTNVCQ